MRKIEEKEEGGKKEREKEMGKKGKEIPTWGYRLF